MVARVKTGIKGFDKLVAGGFPQGSTILYTGTPGTGKTIFGLEYVYNGWTKSKEKGCYISFEEGEREIFDQGKQFGWDLKKLSDAGQVKVISIPARKINKDTSQWIIDYCRKEKVRRLVVDSISTLAVNAPIFSIAEKLSVAA